MLRRYSVRVALAAGAVVGLASCASRLLGLHGVESALVLGVFLPPFVAAAAARCVVADRRAGLAIDGRSLVGRPLALAALVVAVPAALLWLNALRFRQCEPWLGAAFVLLGPLLGCALAAQVGAALGAAVRRPRLATALAALTPVLALLAGLHTFWSSPAVFVFGPFAGYFPGTLYDEGAHVPASYLTFRAMTLSAHGGLALLLCASISPGSGRPSLRGALDAWPRTMLALALLVGAAAVYTQGDTLGLRTSSDHIARELGATARGRRCVVHAPRELGREELRRHVRDCDFRVEGTEAALGVRQRRPIHAFLFRSAEEKARFMGAAGTFVAKPWRDEVYLQLMPWPHPVLHHELVHVVAGNTAQGPLRVGGQLGGWLPDPALIEGVAVAVAWQERDGLTPHQWARAMVELELMPPLSEVLGLSFLRQPSRSAYTVAGSFLRFLLDTRGAEVVREAYLRGDLEAAAGAPIAALERAWLAHLAGVELPEEALALARVRFSQRSIFSAVCPHRVARLSERLGGDLAAGDDGRAVKTCEELLDIDPASVVTRAHLAGALARQGDQARARAEIDVLMGEPPAPEPVIALARLGVADAAWRNGETHEALAEYRLLLDQPQAEEAARQLDVRIAGLEAGGREANLVLALLVGRDGRPASTPYAVHLTRELGETRDDGLGPYLEARQLLFDGRYQEALGLTRAARLRGLHTRRLEREAARMEGLALFALGRLDAGEALQRRRRDAPGATAGDVVDASDWLARIAWTRRERAR